MTSAAQLICNRLTLHEKSTHSVISLCCAFCNFDCVVLLRSVSGRSKYLVNFLIQNRQQEKDSFSVDGVEIIS